MRRAARTGEQQCFCVYAVYAMFARMSGSPV